MARPSVTTILVGLGLVAAVPAAQGAMAVFDGTAVGKAIEQLAELKKQVATELDQLTELKKQVDFLNDINGLMSEVSDAIGSLSHITLPLPNVDRITAQIKSDARCLMPNSAGWGIKFTDLNFGSICETATKYREALFLDTDKLQGMSFPEQQAQRQQVAARRNALLADTTSRALAQADVQMKQADELNNAADGLQSALGNAETMQDRLHVIAQTEIAQTRAMAGQTQILAEMLKIQAAAAIKAGLAPDTQADKKEGGE